MWGGSGNISLCAFHGPLRAQSWSWLDPVANLCVDRVKHCLDHSQVKNLCCQVKTGGCEGSRLSYLQSTASPAWVSEGRVEANNKDAILLRLKGRLPCTRAVAEKNIYVTFWLWLKIIFGAYLLSFLDTQSVPAPCWVNVIYINTGLSKRDRIMGGIKEREIQGGDVAGTRYTHYLNINLCWYFDVSEYPFLIYFYFYPWNFW